MNLIFLIFPIFVLMENAHTQVRKVVYKTDSILTVNTAIGIATIIQLPESIQSAIIGDQSAFKVEYLDKSITIKPLRPGVSTNLYLITEKQRYNIRLGTRFQSRADYIVYVNNMDRKNQEPLWKKINKSQERDGVKFTVEKIGLSISGFVMIEAKLSIENSKYFNVKPIEFGISQEGTQKIVDSLFLSHLVLTKDKPILIGISILKTDLSPNKPLDIEFNSNRKFAITLEEANLWK